MKRQNKPPTASKEKVSQTKDDEQTIKGLNGSDHERFEPHIAFLRAEHDLNTPTVGVIAQNRFIFQGKNRSKERRAALWIGQRHFPGRKATPQRGEFY